MSDSSSDSDDDNRVRNVNNLLLKYHISNDLGVDYGQAHKKKHGDLLFDASFEGANLGRVDQVDQFEYELYIRPDVANPRYRMWFNFTVQNTKSNQVVIFNIVNLSEEMQFYNEGFTPVVRSLSRPNWIRMKESQVFYYRCPKHKLRHVLSLAFRFDNQDDIYQFAMNYPYTASKLESYIDKWRSRSSSLSIDTSNMLSPSPDDEITNTADNRYNGFSSRASSRTEYMSSPTNSVEQHFISTRRLSQATTDTNALAELSHTPESDLFSLNNIVVGRSSRESTATKKRRHSRKNKLQQKNNFHFGVSYVTRSHLDKPVTRLTITETDELTHINHYAHSANPPEIMFDGVRLEQATRCLSDSKKIIVILCRIHPSESPASYVCHGLIDFLLDATDQMAALARRYFIFEIFPLVDPDSVMAGNSRTSILGQDLEKCWLDANEVTHPNISAIKQQLISLLSQNARAKGISKSNDMGHRASSESKSCVDMLIDIHANFHKYGTSISGRFHEDIVRMERHALFPKLLSSVAQDFYIEDCIFRECDTDEMNGLQRIIEQIDQCVDFYTLEVSHFGYYSKASLAGKICYYDQLGYMRIGKSLIYALLDLHRHTGHIPISAIPAESKRLLDSYHADDTDAFRLTLITNNSL